MARHLMIAVAVLLMASNAGAKVTVTPKDVCRSCDLQTQSNLDAEDAAYDQNVLRVDSNERSENVEHHGKVKDIEQSRGSDQETRQAQLAD